MVSEKKLSKLINNGIRLTDTFFEQLKIRVTNDIKMSKDLEDFLARTDEYTTGNILVSSGYAKGMSELILKGLDTRKLRARQRELFMTTVDHTTTELIRDVGDEVKYTIREIVKKGYQTGKVHPTQTAKEIEPVIRDEYNATLENKVKTRLFKKYGDSLTDSEMKQAVNTELDRIAKVRARTIARTEMKRSQTVADYISSKDAGCTHFKISCMDSACPICKNNYKDKEFLIDEIENLPPFHPNCRCIAIFYTKKDYKPTSNNKNNVEFLQDFHNSGDSNNAFPHIQLSEDKLPNIFSNKIKQGFLKFDKKIKNANWEYVYISNLTTDEVGTIYTDKKRRNVKPRTDIQINEGDELLATHNHTGYMPFNPDDVEVIFNNPSLNIRYIVVHTPTDVFIGKFKKGSIHNAKTILTEISNGYGEAIIQRGVEDYVTAGQVWENYKNNKELNKYMSFRRIRK